MIVGPLKVRRKEAPAMPAELMELEVSELIGAERGERRPQDRATHRNGYRPRRWHTRRGDRVAIPKIRFEALASAGRGDHIHNHAQGNPANPVSVKPVKMRFGVPAWV
jgi:Transposase, Mutator family